VLKLYSIRPMSQVAPVDGILILDDDDDDDDGHDDDEFDATA